MRPLAILILLASIAHADPKADDLYRKGELLYTDRHYIDAARMFEQAYQIDPDPAVLFNIAQAYRLGRACVQAARYYHEFLDKVPHPPEAEKLQKYVADMDACAAAEHEAIVPQVIHDTKVVHQTEVVHEQRSLVLPLAIGGVGLAALVVGAVFTYDVHALQNLRDKACEPGCIYGDKVARLNDLDSRGKRAERVEAVGYAVGGAAAVAATVLLVLRSQERDERIIVPAPAPGGATLSAIWTF